MMTVAAYAAALPVTFTRASLLAFRRQASSTLSSDVIERLHKRLCAATPNIILTNQQPGGVFAARSRFEHDASPSSVVG